MIYTNPEYKNHTIKSEPGWLIVHASSIMMAKQAIAIGKKCGVPKCKVTVKGYTGDVEKFAEVKRIEPK